MSSRVIKSLILAEHEGLLRPAALSDIVRLTGAARVDADLAFHEAVLRRLLLPFGSRDYSGDPGQFAYAQAALAAVWPEATSPSAWWPALLGLVAAIETETQARAATLQLWLARGGELRAAVAFEMMNRAPTALDVRERVALVLVVAVRTTVAVGAAPVCVQLLHDLTAADTTRCSAWTPESVDGALVRLCCFAWLTAAEAFATIDTNRFCVL